MKDKYSGFFHSDGTKINPDLIVKPSLCVSCKKDEDPSEEIPCTLTRTDQVNEKEFRCNAFNSKQ